MDHYVLDDPLSAVDATTASSIWSSLFVGEDALLRGKTVIMSTNSSLWLQEADSVVRLGDGTVLEHGRFSELSSQGKRALTGTTSTVSSVPSPKAARVDSKKTAPIPKKSEDPSGTISWDVYWAWLKAAGPITFIFTFFVALFRQGVNGSILIVIQAWASRNEQTLNFRRDGFFSGVLVLTLSGGALLYLLSWLAMIPLAGNAGRKLHKAQLEGVFSTSVQFFDAASSGHTIARFSQDLFILDWDLPATIITGVSPFNRS